MGCYVNPIKETKENFLLREGRSISPDEARVTETEVPVCLVDNGVFSAAGVGFSAGEVATFQRPDGRVKFWFMVPRAKLYDVSDLKSYE